MRRILFSILFTSNIIFLNSCSNNQENQVLTISAHTINAAVNATLTAIPLITYVNPKTATPELIEETPIVETETYTPLSQLAPLYYELVWENLGPMDQEIVINGNTNEKVQLSGSAYKAAMPPGKNDLVNRIRNYYFGNNLSTMGWIMIEGWGGVEGKLTEYYMSSGYFLTVRFFNKQPSSIIVWISDLTTIVPVIP